MTGILRLKVLKETTLQLEMGMFVLSPADDLLADMVAETLDHGRISVNGVKYFIGPINDPTIFSSNGYNHAAKVLVVEHEEGSLLLQNGDYLRSLVPFPLVDRTIQFQPLTVEGKLFAALEA